MMRTIRGSLICASLFLLISAGSGFALETPTPAIPAHAVIGVEESQLSADYWIRRLADADHVILDPAAIATQNAEVLHKDPSMHDLASLPAQLTRAQVLTWIDGISSRPTRALFDIDTGACVGGLRQSPPAAARRRTQAMCRRPDS